MLTEAEQEAANEHLMNVLRQPSPHAKACPAWMYGEDRLCTCPARRKEHDDE